MQPILPIGSIIRDPDRMRYKVEGRLGTGGFGAIYLVRQLRFHKLFALKEVLSANERERKRILFEGEILKRLEHRALPRVYRVFDDSRDELRTYLLMDYIKGADLEYLRQQQPQNRISLSQVLVIMRPVIDAVSYLHSQDPPIIHRDIKPSNIIVPAASDEAVLVDFGLAKEYVPEGVTTTIRQGTPGYAAPEQYGGRTTPRTDIYGLGATLYTLLTGLFPADAIVRVMDDRGGVDPLMPVYHLVPDFPIAVSEDIQRAMSINSYDRFTTVAEFWQTLSAHADVEDVPVPALLARERPIRLAEQTQRTEVLRSRRAEVLQAQTTEILYTPPPLSWPRSRRLLPFVILALLLLIGGGVGLREYLGAATHSRPPVVPHTTSTALPASACRSAAVPASSAGIYPAIDPCYMGTIDDIVSGTKTDMRLTLIRQNGKHLQGYFSGLGLNGPFKGTIDASGHIQFQVTLYGGNTVLAFDGEVKLGGDMVGSYQVLNQNEQYTGEHGLWSITSDAGQVS